MKRNRSKKLALAGAALLMAGVMSGCSIKFGTRREPKLDKVVAYPTNDERLEEMNITYGEFRKEYKYFLLNNEIKDDTDEAVASFCKSRREDIIKYLVNEQIVLRKAREMDVYDLTEEEQKEVDDKFDSMIAEQIKIYGDLAEKELAGETSDTESETPLMTDEEKEESGSRRLDESLEKCGLTRDDLHWWVQSSKITEKLQQAVGDSVPYSRAEEKFEELRKSAEEMYSSDKSMYVMGGYDQVWLPKGSRLIKHILIAFDDDTASEIKELRLEKKDTEADKKRAEAAEGLKSKQEEIEAKLDDGEDIDKLITKYSADAAGSASSPDGYTVIPGGETWMKEFQEAAFVPEKIGDRTTCVTDYGLHIMVYVGDAKITDKAIKNITDTLYEQYKTAEFSDKLAEWTEEYAYEIDYETLRIDAPKDGESE